MYHDEIFAVLTCPQHVIYYRAMLRNSVINITLKIGLSLALLYTALDSFLMPADVLLKWPAFIVHRVDEGTLASFTGIVCLGLIVWLFFGSRKFTSAVTTLVCISLTGLFNILSVSFLFGLAPLFFITLALCFRYYPRVRIVGETLITPLYEGHLKGEVHEKEKLGSGHTGHIDHAGHNDHK